MPPGYNNPEHLKGRKKNGSGWFITINSNKTFEGIGGEAGVQKFKRAVMELFSMPGNLADIIDFRTYKGSDRPELHMEKIEAVEKYISLPVAMEGVIERVGKNSNPLIHAHLIVGIVHWSFIHLNSDSAMKYFKSKLGYGVRFQLGDQNNPAVYRQLPTQAEVARAMHYAGKNLSHDGDYFSGLHEFTIADFENKYGSSELTEEDFAGFE